MLNVICEKGNEETLKEIIFSESTSLGIRSFSFVKDTLARKSETIRTEYGEVKIKRSFFKEREVSCKPDFEDCRKIAIEKGIPVKEVYNKIMASIVQSRK